MSHAIRTASLLCLVLVVAAPAAMAGKNKPATAGDQLKFGVKMAQRGLWSEALFRFKQAEQLDPTDPNVFNNLAVASEALGRFDEALAYYGKALQLAPSDTGVRGNYSRFVEFYQSFKPDAGDAESQAGDADAADAADAADEAEKPGSQGAVVPAGAEKPLVAGSAELGLKPSGYSADS